MKRTILTIVTVVFVVTVFALGVSAVLANKPSEAERFEIFIKNESLIKKLGLTGEQTEKLKTAVGNSYFPHGRDGKPGGDPPAEKAFRMDDEFRAEIYKILTPEQKKQVLTYKFQLDGGLDMNSIYATKLEIFDLTAEQTAKLQTLETERSAQYHEILKPFGMDMRSQEAKEKAGEKPEKEVKKLSQDEMKAAMEKIKEPFAKIGKEYNEKMLSVLTPEQLELAKKLTEEGKGLREEVGLKPLK
jgi:Spy/CpxP family protein refolding chaperone